MKKRVLENMNYRGRKKVFEFEHTYVCWHLILRANTVTIWDNTLHEKGKQELLCSIHLCFSKPENVLMH